jgi:hypothetical protein
MVALFRDQRVDAEFAAAASDPISATGLGNDQIFPAFDETERVGLLYRDLLGAGLAGMWSVDALIAEIGNRRPQLIAAVAPADRPRLPCRSASRMARLGTGLRRAHGRGHRNPFERSAAAVFHPVRGDAADGGLQLGLLGSIIVSETIFGALASDPQSAGGGSLADQLDLISREFYLANVLQDIPEISSMAQLVEFTTEIADLRQAVPAFL